MPRGNDRGGLLARSCSIFGSCVRVWVDAQRERDRLIVAFEAGIARTHRAQDPAIVAVSDRKACGLLRRFVEKDADTKPSAGDRSDDLEVWPCGALCLTGSGGGTGRGTSAGASEGGRRSAVK